MPEIKHSFTNGKMNKDLDERLIPKGHYRDAMNIQIASSDDSNVGTVQNILGNIDGCDTTSWVSPTGPIPTGSKTVGSISDEKNDDLYWLVAGPTSSANDFINQVNNGVNLPLFAKDLIMRKSSTQCEPVLVDQWAAMLDNRDPNIAGSYINSTDTSVISLAYLSQIDNIFVGMNVTAYTCSGAGSETRKIKDISSILSTPTPYSFGGLTQVPNTATPVQETLQVHILMNGMDNSNFIAQHPSGRIYFDETNQLVNIQVGDTIELGQNSDFTPGGQSFLGPTNTSATVTSVVHAASMTGPGPYACTNNAFGIIQGNDYNPNWWLNVNQGYTESCYEMGYFTINQPLYMQGISPAQPLFGPAWNKTVSPHDFPGDKMYSYTPANDGFVEMRWTPALPSTVSIYDNTLNLPQNSPYLSFILDAKNNNQPIYLGEWQGIDHVTGNDVYSDPIWGANACIFLDSVDDFWMLPSPPYPANTLQYDFSFQVVDCNDVNSPVYPSNYPDFGTFASANFVPPPVQITSSFGSEFVTLTGTIDFTADNYCYLHFEADRVLNFEKNKLITGLNIVDDMLYWVDGVGESGTEPKKINIMRSIAGTDPEGDKHTMLINTSLDHTLTTNKVPLRDDHITVIRKSPTKALTLFLNSGREETKTYSAIFQATPTTSATNQSSFIKGPYGTSPSDFSNLNVGDMFVIMLTEDTSGNNDFDLEWKEGDAVLIREYSDSSNTSIGTQPGIPINEYTVRGIIRNEWGWNRYSSHPSMWVPGTATNADTWMAANPQQRQGIAIVQIEITEYNGTPPVAGGNNSDPLNFVIDLEDKTKRVFEFKFPRFSYRYKYEDGEYSVFAPWSQVAFLPGPFSYHPKKGYNLGMTNRAASVIVKDFVPSDMPEDVVSVDILYKEDASPNIYIIDTIKPKDQTSDLENFNHWSKNEYEITSDMIYSVVPSNQLLRPWDNVPLKANSQEVTKNRVVYGNYKQNFDLEIGGSNYYPDFNISLTSFKEDESTVIRSIKSLREYQLGVVFVDKYGRETPVITSNRGSLTVEKAASVTGNKLDVRLGSGNGYPSQMSYFKFFIKESSGEYYNMAMDRFYDAEDDNIWLAFPSTDRNKIEVDDYLILKKGVESNELVKEDARYKILAIENEAPDFIKQSKYEIDNKGNNDVVPPANAGAGTWPTAGQNLFDNSDLLKCPRFGQTDFKMEYAAWKNSAGKDFYSHNQNQEGHLYVEFSRKSKSVRTQRYRVSEITWDNAGVYNSNGSGPNLNGYYNVKIEKPFEEDINMICDDPTGVSPTKIFEDAKIHVYKYVVENKSQFDGRFFVKIHRDTVLQEHIKPVFDPLTIDYSISHTERIWYAKSDMVGGTPEFLNLPSSGSTTYDPYDSSVLSTLNNSGGLKIWALGGCNTQVINTSLGGNWDNNFCEVQKWMTFLGHHPDNGEPDTATDVDAVILPPSNRLNINDWDPEGFTPGPTFWKRMNEYNRKHAEKGMWFVDDGDFAGRHYEGTGSNSNAFFYSSWLGGGTAMGGLTNYSESSRVNMSFGPIPFWDGDGDVIGDSIKSVVFGNYRIEQINNFYLIGEDSITSKTKAEEGMRRSITQPSQKFRFKEDPNGTIYTFKAGGDAPMNVANGTDLQSYGSDEENGGTSAFNNRRQYQFWCEPAWAQGFDPIESQAGNGLIDNGAIIADIQIVDNNGNENNGTTNTKLCNGATCTATITDMKNAEIYVKDIVGTNTGPGPSNGTPLSVSVGMVLTQHAGATTGINANNRPMVREIIEDTSGTFYTLKLQGVEDGFHLTNDFGFSPNCTTGNYYTFQQPVMNGYSPVQAFLRSSKDQTTGHMGSVHYTMEFVEETSPIELLPKNPAVWETEPKEKPELDIYYEASDYLPTKLNTGTIETILPVGTRVSDNNVNIQTPLFIFNNSLSPDGDEISFGPYTPCSTDGTTVVSGPCNDPIIGTAQQTSTGQGSNVLRFHKPDGTSFLIRVKNVVVNPNGLSATYKLHTDLYKNTTYSLGWFNCYSFNNGVESNRIRDNYNLPFISNGVKASTVIPEEYGEEHRKYGLIYSGIYNSKSGVNSLNQFIQAEKITKDVNPIYGSIQRLHTRDSDLITLCEDKVLKILANKDALYNADGNAQLTATENVLGQTVPFVGEYGISTNPESFASESYRSYFTDKVRGAVMRLSRDGLTPISDHGMKDWFRDNLKLTNDIIGSYDDKKQEYNLTLHKPDEPILPGATITSVVNNTTTLTFKESIKGWVSFKSFIQENGISCANEYYTFKEGQLWKHHYEGTMSSPHSRNSFYGSFLPSSITLSLNDSPETVKSFMTLGYEGSASKVNQVLEYNTLTPGTNNIISTLNEDQYYNLASKNGWYVNNIKTDKEEGSLNEFIEKEGKWFNYLRGKPVSVDATGHITNHFDSYDTGSFAIQGLGQLSGNPQTTSLYGCTCDGTTVDCFNNSNYGFGHCTRLGLIGAFPGAIHTAVHINGVEEHRNEADCIADGYCSGPNDFVSDNETDCLDPQINGGTGNWTNYIWTPVDTSAYAGQPAANFNAVHSIDDGSCYPTINGCMDPLADNYNDLNLDGTKDPLTLSIMLDVNNDDGSCVIEGCRDPQAFNYDPNANVSCVDANPNGGVTDGTYGYGDPTFLGDYCCIPKTFGCTDASTFVGTDGNTYNQWVEYDVWANTDTNPTMCQTQTILGCTDPADACACQNGCNTDFLDPTFAGPPGVTGGVQGCCDVPGCSDWIAGNYDPAVNVPNNDKCKYCGWEEFMQIKSDGNPGNNILTFPNITNFDGGIDCIDLNNNIIAAHSGHNSNFHACTNDPNFSHIVRYGDPLGPNPPGGGTPGQGCLFCLGNGGVEYHADGAVPNVGDYFDVGSGWAFDQNEFPPNVFLGQGLPQDYNGNQVLASHVPFNTTIPNELTINWRSPDTNAPHGPNQFGVARVWRWWLQLINEDLNFTVFGPVAIYGNSLNGTNPIGNGFSVGLGATPVYAVGDWTPSQSNPKFVSVTVKNLIPGNYSIKIRAGCPIFSPGQQNYGIGILDMPYSYITGAVVT